MDQIVPPPSDAPPSPQRLPVTPEATPTPPRSRRRTLAYLAGAAFGLLVLALLGSAFVTTPYYRLAPGSVRTTEELIAVDGAPSYLDDTGTVGYTTVSMGPASGLELLTGWLDPDVELLTKEEALGDQDPDENREVNLQLMDSSKQVAAAVALTELGYEVRSTGTGAMVMAVEEGTPAADVLSRGDTVTAVDGQVIERNDQLGSALESSAPGDEVTLRIERPRDLGEPGSPMRPLPDGAAEATTVARPDGAPMSDVAAFEVTVTLAARPDDAAKAFLGVSTVTRDQQYVMPFTVEIDSGSVGGPSAGLAFTLGVIDVLTPGSLTGGRKVATTGTINIDGTVGQVGGVHQKTVAVRQAGAEIFLVPPEEYEEALAHAGDDLQVISVANLDEALAALAGAGGDTTGLDGRDLAAGTTATPGG